MLLNKTESICPVCKKAIQADIIERDSSIFMQKSCGEHGFFEKKIAKHAWYYKGLNNLLKILYPPDFSKHKKCFTFALFITGRCNLKCPICFSDAGISGNREEPTLDGIEAQLARLKNQRQIIRLTGGEPTERKDISDIIRLIVRSGNIASLFTNGLKLADIEFVKKLKKAGLTEVIIWLDTLKNERIHEIMRGEGVLARKLKALENIKKTGIPCRIYHVKAKNLNDPDTRDCLEYVRNDRSINNLWIRGYAHLGRKGLTQENEFLMDELVEDVAKGSDGAFTLEDAYYYQKLSCIHSAIRGIPSCYYGQSVLLPRSGNETVRRIFDLDKFSKTLDKVEDMWGNDPGEAKRYFAVKLRSILMKKPYLLYWSINKHFLKNPFDTRYLPRGYLDLYMSLLYTPFDYDKTNISKGCFAGDLMLGPQDCISLCDLLSTKFG